jgi:hypothetical protein
VLDGSVGIAFAYSDIPAWAVRLEAVPA